MLENGNNVLDFLELLEYFWILGYIGYKSKYRKKEK